MKTLTLPVCPYSVTVTGSAHRHLDVMLTKACISGAMLACVLARDWILETNIRSCSAFQGCHFVVTSLTHLA